MFPSESTVFSEILNHPVPRNCLTHTKSPDKFNFTTKPSDPFDVRFVVPAEGSKS